MEKLRTFHLGLLLALAVVLASCSANPVPKPPKPDESFIFGYIDMEDAPTWLHWATIRQFKPPTKKPYFSAGAYQGVFYNWYFGPGSYAVTKFGGSAGRTNYTFGIPRQLTEMRVKFDKPGIYFLGSFKYKDIKTGFFEQGKYDLEKADKPTEKEVVEKLLKLVKGTAVEPRLKKHLEGLK